MSPDSAPAGPYTNLSSSARKPDFIRRRYYRRTIADDTPIANTPDSSPPEKHAGRPRRTDWQDAFLENFALHGIKTRAAKTVGVDVKTVDKERVRDERFAVRYLDAYEEAADNLETFAHRWATVGLESRDEDVTYDADGKVVRRTVKTSSDVSPTLLIFMLKAMRPRKYRENVKVEQTGPGGGPLRVVIDGDRIDREISKLLGDLAPGG